MNNSTDLALIQSYSIEELIPVKNEILSSMGINKEIDFTDDIKHLYDEAMKLFKELVDAKGLVRSIDLEQFQEILKDNENYESIIPLQDVIKNAKQLALFIFTLGKPLNDKIQSLIHEKDYPLGYALDIIASRSAEQATIIQEKRFLKNNNTDSNLKALLYSPGYCGWHISVQKKIFEYLNPEKIGITHNDGFLMTPIKSVSGILVVGEKNIHNFKNNFSFCKDCISHTCISRMRQ